MEISETNTLLTSNSIERTPQFAISALLTPPSTPENPRKRSHDSVDATEVLEHTPTSLGKMLFERHANRSQGNLTPSLKILAEVPAMKKDRLMIAYAAFLTGLAGHDHHKKNVADHVQRVMKVGKLISFACPDDIEKFKTSKENLMNLLFSYEQRYVNEYVSSNT